MQQKKTKKQTKQNKKKNKKKNEDCAELEHMAIVYIGPASNQLHTRK